MPYKLIGEDCNIQLEIGGVCNYSINPNAAPTNPSATVFLDITGVARRIGIRTSVERRNVQGVGDFSKSNRYHAQEGSLEIEQFVGSTSINPDDTGAANVNVTRNLVGRYVSASYKPLSTLTIPWLFVGVITDWDYSGAVGTEQTIKLTIDLNPDYMLPA